jgi:hypothetical protein
VDAPDDDDDGDDSDGDDSKGDGDDVALELFESSVRF